MFIAKWIPTKKTRRGAYEDRYLYTTNHSQVTD